MRSATCRSSSLKPKGCYRDTGWLTSVADRSGALKVSGKAFAAFAAPAAFVSWEGYLLNVCAPRQEDQLGRTWVFGSWSDGGARDHTITTPAGPPTYTAAFKRLR